MAYNNGARKTQNFSYNKNRSDNSSRRPRTENTAPKFPKKETFAFPIIDEFTVTDKQNGTVVIDKDVILDTLQDLNDSGVFKVLTQNVGISNSLLHNDATKKGSATVGYIDSVDVETNNINVTIFGSSVERIKEMADSLTVRPKVIANRGEFRCFNGFDLIAITM